MIRNHTSNEALINLSSFFDLEKTEAPEPTRDRMGAEAIDGSDDDDWKSPFDFEAVLAHPELKNKMSKAKHLAEEGRCARAIHARSENEAESSEYATATADDRTSPTAWKDLSQRPREQRKPSSEAADKAQEDDTLALLLDAAGKAEKANEALTSSMVELSKKTESAEAIVQRIDVVASDAIARIESSVQESFRAIPKGSGAQTALDTNEIEKLQSNLTDMLANEYRRHAESLERLATSYTPAGTNNSELWESITSYIGEKLDYVERSIDEKIAKQLANVTVNEKIAGDDPSAIEERIMVMEKQYRLSRKSTAIMGASLFVSLAAIAISVGSGLSFQQIFSVFFGA